MHGRLLLIVLLTFGLITAACSSTDATLPESPDGQSAPDTTQAEPAEPEKPETVPPEESMAGDTPAPEFPEGLDWINTARPLTLEELRGKIVLLDFWTYGCINCIHVIPDLKRLEAEHPDELVVIGVHSAKFLNEGATENIRQVVLRYGVEHPVVNDQNFVVWNRWGAQAWPTTVLVDPAGNIVGGHSGEGVYDVVKPVITSLSNEFDARGELDRTPLDLELEADQQPSRVLSFPGKVHVAEGDARVFVADTGHHRVVVADRTTGEVLDVYGSGHQGFADGRTTDAQFDSPQGMVLDDDGATLYVADTNNHAIRSVNTTTGDVTTLLGTGSIGWPPTGGTAPGVALNSPWDVLVSGDTLYIAMAGHHQIWEMDLASGIALPIVGNAGEGVLNGPLEEAELAQPSGLALSSDGILYFADSESSSIRSADLAAAAGTTALVAGGSESLFEFGDADGVGEAARLQHPLGVDIWAGDDSLIVADTYNSRLRRIDPVSREVTTFLGGEQGWADGTEAQFSEPGGLSIDGATAFVADTNNHSIRVVDLATGSASTLVLIGIEAFEPEAGEADYRGTIVALDPVTVSPGAGQITLEVLLPAGYKLNDEATSSLVWGGDAKAGVDGVIDLTGATLPATFAANFTASGELVADATLLYCRDTAESLCLIEQVRFRLPVEVADDGVSTVTLPHSIVLPDVDGG